MKNCQKWRDLTSWLLVGVEFPMVFEWLVCSTWIGDQVWWHRVSYFHVKMKLWKHTREWNGSKQPKRGVFNLSYYFGIKMWFFGEIYCNQERKPWKTNAFHCFSKQIKKNRFLKKIGFSKSKIGFQKLGSKIYETTVRTRWWKLEKIWGYLSLYLNSQWASSGIGDFLN